MHYLLIFCDYFYFVRYYTKTKKKKKVKNNIYQSNITKQNVSVNVLGSTPLGDTTSHMQVPKTTPLNLLILKNQ